MQYQTISYSKSFSCSGEIKVWKCLKLFVFFFCQWSFSQTLIFLVFSEQQNRELKSSCLCLMTDRVKDGIPHDQRALILSFLSYQAFKCFSDQIYSFQHSNSCDFSALILIFMNNPTSHIILLIFFKKKNVLKK